MKWPIISTLVLKDAKLYYRDKFFGVMTIFSFVLFVAFFFIMPRSVDETIEIGIHGSLARGLRRKA